MRTIKSRNNRQVYMHKPVGESNVKRAAYLSISDVLKKTSIPERQKMIEDSPLYDEFKAGTPIDSLAILDYLDLSVQPLDLTDADQLRLLAKNKVEEIYSEFEKRKKEKEQNLSENTPVNEASTVKVL